MLECYGHQGKPCLTGRTADASDLRDRPAGRPRGVAHRRHHRRVPGQAGPPRRAALGVRRRGRRRPAVHGGRRPAAGDLAEPAAAPAREPGDRHRRHRRPDGHLHGRLDEAALPRPEGPSGGRDDLRARGRLGFRPGDDGIPRRYARGLRDRRVPACRVQRELGRSARRARRAAGRPGGGRPRIRHLPRRGAAEPVAVLPCYRPGPRAGRWRLGRERVTYRARSRVAQRRATSHAGSERGGPARSRPRC